MDNMISLTREDLEV